MLLEVRARLGPFYVQAHLRYKWETALLLVWHYSYKCSFHMASAPAPAESYRELSPINLELRAACRLTLVKGWNMEELKDYVKLLELGQPDFIEIKGAPCWSPSALHESSGRHGSNGLTDMNGDQTHSINFLGW